MAKTAVNIDSAEASWLKISILSSPAIFFRCQVCERASERITIRKMPLNRREFGKMNSVLNIVHLPAIDEEEEFDE